MLSHAGSSGKNFSASLVLQCTYICIYNISMDFEWDDAKRQANLAKHRVDFVDVQELLDGRPVFTAVSQHPDEQRFVTTGILDGRFYTVIWTWRGDNIRLISARRARDAEQRHYRALHGGGT